jgi:putative N-acetylmannosamine-6-phosphate epimerase
MNNGIVNTATAALNRIMDCIPSVHTIGERIFLSRQAGEMRRRIDTADDILANHQMKLISELTIAVKQDARNQNHIEALLSELLEMAEKRAKLEAVDDQLAAKDHSYKKAIVAAYEKAHDLLRTASSGLENLIQHLTNHFRKRRAI